MSFKSTAQMWFLRALHVLGVFYSVLNYSILYVLKQMDIFLPIQWLRFTYLGYEYG